MAIGLNLQGGTSEVRGLAINRFAGAGIVLVSNPGNIIEGNFIGSDSTGLVAQPNAGHGILVPHPAIGLAAARAAARNVISGNGGVGIKLETAAAAGNLIQGNYIGVSATGFGAVATTAPASPSTRRTIGNTIGGLSSAGSGNLISGNAGAGISLAGAITGTIVIGNRIGTDDFATTSIPNGADGISVTGGSANIIGGTAGGAGNIISGNALNGVAISGAGAAGNVVLNNLIGTNNSGMSAIGNGAEGVLVSGAPSNTIGSPGVGNVISGNGRNGIAIVGADSTNTQIYANRIGANFESTGAIPNQQDGIRIDGAGGTVIGNGTPQGRNIIGGNVQHGIALYGGAANTAIFGNTVGFSAPLVFLGNALDGIQVNNASVTTIGGTDPSGQPDFAERPKRCRDDRRGRQPRVAATASSTTAPSESIWATTAYRQTTPAMSNRAEHAAELPGADRGGRWSPGHAEQHRQFVIPD